MLRLDSFITFFRFQKMRKTLELFSLLLLTAMFGACEDYTKDLTDVAIFIKPGASDTLKVNAGDNVRYEIDMHTTHNYISRLQVTSFDRVQNYQVVKDTTFTSRQDKYFFYYKAPLLNEGVTPVTLHFYGYDDAGSKGEAERHLTVIGRQVLLGELTGLVWWSPALGLPNAFMFEAPSQSFFYLPSDEANEETSQEKLPDVYITTDDSFTTVDLNTATGTKFVRNNSFDYANATAASIQSVYGSSRRLDAISDLRVNDIILMGHGDTAAGVLSVTSIVRDGTSEERSLRLSFKGLNSRK